MSAPPPSETLNPPMNSDDSCGQSASPESLIQPTAKRMRESADDNPETSPSPNQNPLWKTTLCSYFRRSNGECSHGDACRYAHGELELRPRPDNTWDPTSERVKKMARTEEEENENSGNEEGRSGNAVMMTEALAGAEDGGSAAGETALTKCLVNLPMRWTADNLRNFLKEHGIYFQSSKKKKGMVVGFVTFESVEQVNTALQELDGKSVGNKNLKVADVIPRSFETKNNMAEKNKSVTPSDNHEPANNLEGGEPTYENLPPSGEDVKIRTVRDAVTPLAHLPYADQLLHKKSSLMQMLKKLTRNARKACPNGVSLPEWILKSREIGGLPCTLEGIVESPLINGYRNKCEFSVGYSLQGKPTVGFLLGNFREGVTAVEEPVDCPNVSRISCRYAAIFQDFLQSSSLPIWNRLNNTGFWRQLTVREGRMENTTDKADNSGWSVSEVMLIVQVCTVGLDEELVNAEFQRLAQAFSDGAAAESPCLPLTSLIVQDHTGISNVAPADAPLRFLSTAKYASDSEQAATSDIINAGIHDYISNLKFRISPTAFFQVNTLAAEKLYALAGDWAGLGPDTLLFDICCGTGTIGLTLAHCVGMVVGIEMNASAVSDAKRNAEINGIKNCRFVCSKAEDVMDSLLKEYLSLPQKEDVVLEEMDKGNNEIKFAEGELKPTDVAQDEEERSAVEQQDCHHENASLNVEGQEEISAAGQQDVHHENAPLDLEGQEKGSDAEQQDGHLENAPLNLECQEEKSITANNITHSVNRFKNIVAIVDPPRVGLHPTVIKVLRTHSTLKRLVYISCNPESLVANAIELCTPSVEKSDKENNKNNRGWRKMSSAGLARHRTKSMPVSEPFKPIKAMAVDLFPHTPHCELVMLLER